MKRKIRKEIKDYRDGREDRQFENKELFKPIITSQKEVKETIDKKQDKLIEQLQENQNFIQSVDVLSDIMSKHGSTGGVERWISDLPSKFDPLDTIEEDSDGKEDSDDEEGDIFSNAEKEIIKKYGFDYNMKDIPTQKDI